ncbi:APC family permease [Rothia sp. AR01]|uniref:APC family permease n=1 Tax=Rothia santali TaxID=2949643 RepID=A0A9X2HGW8_9MICC|nr:APC family permease [Rothia santali]MCP3427114.1 APC family permease [Rothia santali]
MGTSEKRPGRRRVPIHTSTSPVVRKVGGSSVVIGVDQGRAAGSDAVQEAGRATGLSAKGLSAGTIGLLGAAVIGVSTIAPAYTLSGALGPTVSVVGFHLPAIFLVGFIPMLLVALGYRELNSAMPDSGTTFTWVSKAFGPWVGWMGGWGLLAATILVLSNLAGIAVDFFYLLIAQLAGSPGIADLARNVPLNVATCLVFMAGACWISYRGLQETKRFQFTLVGFQLVVLVAFAVTGLVRAANGSAFDGQLPQLEWFNPAGIDSFSAFSAGVSLSVFIYWGWDTVLTMNEETKDPERTPGRAAIVVIGVVVVLYLLVACGTLAFAGVGDGALGMTNPDIQENIFAALATPVLGPLGVLMSIAVLMSSIASLQSTMISPARTMLAMSHYRALPARFARIHPRFQTPGYATVASTVIAAAFYAVMRFISEDVLWDTIAALGLMVCYYYGLTALACAWYFRREAFGSVRAFVVRLAAPLLGGLLLLVFFVRTTIDSFDPDYGSGSSLFGVGLVFYLGAGMIVLGLVVMLVLSRRMPQFFREGVDAVQARSGPAE